MIFSRPLKGPFRFVAFLLRIERLTSSQCLLSLCLFSGPRGVADVLAKPPLICDLYDAPLLSDQFSLSIYWGSKTVSFVPPMSDGVPPIFFPQVQLDRSSLANILSLCIITGCVASFYFLSKENAQWTLLTFTFFFFSLPWNKRSQFAPR